MPFWWPQKAEALFREGQANLMIDRAKDAETAWLAAVEDDPLHPRPRRSFTMLASSCSSFISPRTAGKTPTWFSGEAYGHASPVDHPSLLSMRIRSELERVAHEQAIVQLERLHRRGPHRLGSIRALARAEMAVGHPAEARRHFQDYVKAQPENPRGWRDYLTMLHELGDLDTLIDALAKLPQVTESEPEIWRIRGQMKEKAGRLNEAAHGYRMALERNPFALSSHYRLGMVEERLGHRDVAAEHRRQAETCAGARAVEDGLRRLLDGSSTSRPRRTRPEGIDQATGLGL